MSSSFLYINGKKAECECGCSIFHRGEEKGLWYCNGCNRCYVDETYKWAISFKRKDIIQKCTDKELAEIITSLRTINNHYIGLSKIYSNKEEAINFWLQWLNEEV